MLGSIHNSTKGYIMEISSVSSSIPNVAAAQTQSQLARVKEVENDKDKDDGASKQVAQAAPRASVNTNGQVVGSIVNTQAWFYMLHAASC